MLNTSLLPNVCVAAAASEALNRSVPAAGLKWLWSACAFSETMSGAGAPFDGNSNAPAPIRVLFVHKSLIAVLFAVPAAAAPSAWLTAVAPSDRKS